ncbi:MAG: hypothetical protein ACUVWX_08770 [Kiritimatiellia bacterium]
MRAKPPLIWCVDLVYPIDPLASLPEAVKALPNAPWENELWSAAKGQVRLAGAVNETLAFQLALEKKAGRVKAIQVEGADDLNITLYQNVAVPVEGNYADDALVPIEREDCGEQIDFVTRRSPRLPSRQRHNFTVEVCIPKGSRPGRRTLILKMLTTRRQLTLDIVLEVYNFELPDEPECNADINNYSRSAATGFDIPEEDLEGYLRIERQYFRMARAHRALFHVLPYGQSGRLERGFAPLLSGRGRTRHVVDWSAFDRHWGPYLDGSAFADLPGGARPVEYLYLPVNCNWPAYFEKYGTPGYWLEYQQVLRDIAAHFAECGWTKTRFEVFFNHKARWKYFPWDMDEIRFERDNYATIEYARKALEAVKDFSQVQIVSRIDSSWIFDRSAYTEMQDLIKLWVVNRSSHSQAPAEVAHLRARGACVWFYGGAGPILAPTRLDNLRWPWIAWGRDTDGFCWWNGLAWGSWDNVGNGTGHCFYPGRRFEIQGPLPSLRLKVLHRGIQDHAYLSLLTRQAGRQRADAVVGEHLGAACREDWYERGEPSEAGGADIQSGSRTEKVWNTAPPTAFEKTRRVLARAIEERQG